MPTGQLDNVVPSLYGQGPLSQGSRVGERTISAAEREEIGFGAYAQYPPRRVTTGLCCRSTVAIYDSRAGFDPPDLLGGYLANVGVNPGCQDDPEARAR